MSDLTAALKVIAGHSVKKGDLPEHAARSDFINAVRDAILSLARGENIGRGVGIRKRAGEGTFILSADRGGGGRGGSGDFDFPFKVIEGMTTDQDPNVPTISFFVGKIGNSIPMFDGAPLDDTPELALQSAGDFSAWLQVNISCPFDNYHPQIDDSLISIDGAGDTPDREDWKVEWEDEGNRVSGAFFVKIADFTVESAGDPQRLNISSIDQWLNQSYRSIVMVGFVENDFIFPVG